MTLKTLLSFTAAVLTLGAVAAPLKIMPLGDSITYGQGWDPHGGYRALLREKLVQAGYDVDYVGTQDRNQGTLAESGDVQHEGHPGWVATGLNSSFPSWSAQIEGPNLILLKIGTNSCNQDHARTIAEIETLLETIHRCQPSAHVIVATIVTFLNGTELGSNDAWVQEHNRLLKRKIAERVAAGKKESLADLYPAVCTPELMNDDRHPNQAGYRAMAEVWFDAIKALYPDPTTAGGAVDLAAVSCTMDETSADRFTVAFNDPVGDEAANLAHYTFNAAFTPAAATLSADRKSVTITGAKPVKAGVTCTVAIAGVPNAAGTKTVVPASFDFRYLPYGAKHYVEEAGKYRKLYEFTFTNQKYGAEAPTYDFDDHLAVGAFTRVAYYIELQKEGEEMQYLWVSMDKFTDDAGRIAIPTKFALTEPQEIIQTFVTNLKVVSNVPTITSGDKARGNLEFWPYSYYANNEKGLGIAGTSNGAYDIDDSCNRSGNFACMQIHDTDALVPLFCYNNWGGNNAGGYDLGLGPRTGYTNIDWTQSNSSGNWNKRRHLEIYVMEDVADTTVPQVVSSDFSEDRTTMTVVFDRPVLAEDGLLAKATLMDGTPIASATLTDEKTIVVTFKALRRVRGVSLVLNGLHGASPAHPAIPTVTLALPGEDLPFGYPAAPESVVEKVAEAADYAHLYTIALTPGMRINVKDGTSYVNKVDEAAYAAAHVVDNHEAAPEYYSRVGYLLELVDNSGNVKWIWTSFDAFSNDYGDIDIPTANPDHPKGGYINGRYVANLDVASNVGGIVTGKGLKTGLIEFTPWDYGSANKRNVPNATAGYDFGDDLYERVGAYSCMQVHNYAAELADGKVGQVLWAVGKFNGTGLCVGIGNSTNGNNIDYTFDGAGNWKSRTLYVLVKPDFDADTSTDYEPVRAVAALDRQHVAVSFKSAVRASAAQERYYSVSGGTVVSAELSAIDARDVILTLREPLAENASYTVSTLFPKSTNKEMAIFTERPLPEALVNGVEELGDYMLLNDITVPYNWNVSRDGADYRTDESRFGLPRKVKRVAYALEIQDNDNIEGANYRWAWVSMDPFTDDPAKMGLPTVTREIHFQQYVDNISVRSGSSTGVAPIKTGEWPKGNIEFTPSNYAGDNKMGIPDATGACDWGDNLYGNATSAGHGCLQIHNYLEKDMVLGVSRLGNGMVAGLNIGLIRNADGSVKDDGTYTANRHLCKVHEFRVFVQLEPEVPPTPITGDKGLGPTFLIQPQSHKVKLPPGAGAQKTSLNAYAPEAVRYQWRKNGVDLEGATSPVLDILVTARGTDSYQCIAFIDEDNYTFSDVATVEGVPMPFVFIVR